MIALFISNDPGLLDEGSAVQTRMQAYATEIGTLHILCRAQHTTTYTKGSLTIHGVAASRLAMLRVFPRVIRDLIHTLHIEIVSAQDPFEHGLVALYGVRGTSAKLHIQVHTDFLSPWFVRGVSSRMRMLNLLRRHIAAKVLPHAKGIRVVSERVKLSLMAQYDRRIVEPVILPIALVQNIPAQVPLPARPFSFSFITVGRLEPEKRIKDQLYALAEIKYRHPEVGLCIVGEGRQTAELTALVHGLSLSAQVLFLGARSDAWGLMQSADAILQTSAYEGYGLTLLEAALAQRPLISTTVGIIGEVLRPGHEVLAVPVGDREAIAAAMLICIEQPEKRTALAHAAATAAGAYVKTISTGPKAIAKNLAATLTHV